MDWFRSHATRRMHQLMNQTEFVTMGLRDRDYMRRKPSDEDWQDWREHEEANSELSRADFVERRKAGIKKVVVAFVVFVVLVVIIGALVSSK